MPPPCSERRESGCWTSEDSGWDGDCSSQSLVGAAFDDVVTAVRDVVADERPDVVVTLDPGGGDGHRDHVRIAQATTAAFDEAAPDGSSLYYWCLVRSVMRQWAAHNRGSVYARYRTIEFGCPDELITTVVDVHRPAATSTRGASASTEVRRPRTTTCPPTCRLRSWRLIA